MKRSEIWDSGVVVIWIGAPLDALVFKVILGSFLCTCLKMACAPKTIGREAKRSGIWELGGGGVDS